MGLIINEMKVIEGFYQAFKEMDAEKMVSFYHDDVVFEDPAFGKLEGERAKNMWRMLIASQQGKEFEVNYSNVLETESKGAANWEAKYLFSQTGNKVHNKIAAKFELKAGLIVRHTDSFNLHAWAKQALGFKGFLLGGSNFFRKKLNDQTNRLLDKFEAKSV